MWQKKRAEKENQISSINCVMNSGNVMDGCNCGDDDTDIALYGVINMTDDVFNVRLNRKKTSYHSLDPIKTCIASAVEINL